MKPPLIIWGSGGHARVIVDIVNLNGDYEIIGFLDDTNSRQRHVPFCTAPILGGAEQLEELRREGVENLTLGFGNCQARMALAKIARSKGFALATLIHPGAIIAQDVVIGSGTVIAAGAVVNPGTSLGQNVIINTGATVDHECVIGDGAHVCPGVHLAGNVLVGAMAWVGIGATVIQKVTIGARAIIGAGAVVLHDIPEDATAYGVPAKIKKGAINP